MGKGNLLVKNNPLSFLAGIDMGYNSLLSSDRIFFTDIAVDFDSFDDSKLDLEAERGDKEGSIRSCGEGRPPK